MAMTKAAQARRVEKILSAFDDNRHLIESFMNQLMIAMEANPPLMEEIHSTKARVKDRDHLRDKLLRKAEKCRKASESFDIQPDNLLVAVTDLAGIRLLHLYTRQIEKIHAALLSVFAEGGYELVEPPFARTWDDESRELFRSCGIQTQDSPTMYTSVHYVVSSASRTTITCEVQVRTLMEEVWGEVDHMINYPHPTTVLSSTEQLKVLARVTSSASRLVDSIFLTHSDV